MVRQHRHRRRVRSEFLRQIMLAVMPFFRLNIRKKIMIAGSAFAVIFALVLLLALPPRSIEAAVRQTNAAVQQTNTATQSVSPETVDIINSPSPSVPSPEAQATPSLTPSISPAPDRTLKKGDENDRVKELQERLMDLGYMDIDESTKLYGPATKYAVQLFQRQHGIKQNGIAGPDTLDAIFSSAAKKYMLLEGTRGTDVDSLQRQLIDLGYLEKATGYYGSETVEAVKAFQERNSLSPDGKTGEATLDLIYSPKAKVSATKAQAERRKANISKMIQVAQKQLGRPYILGNEGPRSFDCSGLVYYCLKQAGSSRGRYNAAGYSQVDDWKKISMNELQKGDLLFFWHKGKTRVGHVGIYIGDGMMIDASSSNGKVVKRSCVTPYWKSMFVTARRPW